MTSKVAEDRRDAVAEGVVAEHVQVRDAADHAFPRDEVHEVVRRARLVRLPIGFDLP